MMTKLFGTWLNPSSDYYYSAIILIATCIIDGAIGLIALYLYWRQNMYRFMGNKFLKKNKILPAIEAFERHKKINPEDKETQKRLCALYVQEEIASDNAIAAYKEALELDPFAKDVCKALAAAYAKRGRLDDEAVTCYGRAVQFFPNTPLFIAMMGRAYHKKGDVKPALEFLERAVELGHKNTFTYEALCALYLKENMYTEKAKQAAQSFLRLKPDAMEPRILLCKIYLSNADISASEKEARALFEKDRTSPMFLELYADVLLVKGEYKLAEQNYVQVLKQNSENKKILINLSKAMIFSLRRDEEALGIYQKVKDEMEIPAEIHNLLYDHFLLKRNYTEARKQLYYYSAAQNDFKSSLKSMEDLCSKEADAEGYAYLGNLYLKNRLMPEAAASFKKVLSLDGEFPPVLAEGIESYVSAAPDAVLFGALARLYDTDGSREKSIFILKKALEHFPEEKNLQEMLEKICLGFLKENKEDAEVRFTLACHYKNMRKFDDGIAHFQLCENTEYDEASLFHTAECFTAKDLPDVAAEHLQKLIRRSELKNLQKADVYFAYGAACEKTGKINEALEAYFKTFHENKNYPGAEQKIEKLQKGMTLGSMQTLVVEHPEEIKQRYEIQNEVGKGTFGVVYLARDTLLERDVAVKILHDRFLFNKRVKERFFKEARASAVLSHKNIISIYDVGELGGKHYICMEYVDGLSLEALMKNGKTFSTDEVKAIALQICDALEHAHQKNIIHGNIHPKNIFMKQDGTVKISDFSLNQTLTEFTNTLSGGSFLENPYLSPEEIIGEENDARSDMYSLGILLARLLTGKLPFKDADEKLKNLPPVFDDKDATLEFVIEKCLQQDKAKRFQNIAELKSRIIERA